MVVVVITVMVVTLNCGIGNNGSMVWGMGSWWRGSTGDDASDVGDGVGGGGGEFCNILVHIVLDYITLIEKKIKNQREPIHFRQVTRNGL